MKIITRDLNGDWKVTEREGYKNIIAKQEIEINELKEELKMVRHKYSQHLMFCTDVNPDHLPSTTIV